MRLDWETAAETNNDHFIVQRSADASNWSDITSLTAVGNSNSDSYYIAYDQSPLSGISYYRLKQTNSDGKFTFSAVRKIEFLESYLLQALSESASNFITIGDLNSEKTHVMLFNSIGQRITVPSAMDGNKVTLFVSGLRSGVYFVQIIEDGKVNTG